jgi:2-polyprenyl-3-methyl-5-hydroxy-6-metoxy-1,4-benzoquinol methylase
VNTNVSCNVCGEPTYRVLACLRSEDGHQYQAVKCTGCGLIYANPMPRLTSDELSELYGAEYTESQRDLEDNEQQKRMLYEATARQMEMVETLVNKGRALNVGAVGSASKVLQDRGWQLDVVEVSRYAAETAQGQWGLNVTIGRIEDVDFPPGSFDFVKLGHVIEHLVDPALVLRRLNTFLKNDGLILIDTDNALGVRTISETTIRGWLGERLAGYLVKKLTGKNLHKRYGRLSPPVHLYLFSRHTLTLLLEKSGFRVIKLLEPAHGDSTWFPTTTGDGTSLVEKLFLGVDRVGAMFGAGEVLVAFARKAK